MNHDQFQACAKRLVPLLNDAMSVLKEYGTGGKYLRMVVSDDYICAEGDALGGWSLVRGNDGWVMRYNYSASLLPDGGEAERDE